MRSAIFYKRFKYLCLKLILFKNSSDNLSQDASFQQPLHHPPIAAQSEFYRSAISAKRYWLNHIGIENCFNCSHKLQ